MNRKKLALVALAALLSLCVGAAVGRCSAVHSQGDAADTAVEEATENSGQGSEEDAQAEESTYEGGIDVSGLKDDYLALVDGKEDALRRAITTYCRANVPAAAKATFDGEVYLAMNAGAVAATFHCDDVAATILQVTYEHGAFAVAG